MIPYDMNLYGRHPSGRHTEHQHALPTMGSSMQATISMSYPHNFPNSNRHIVQSLEDTDYQDGTTPLGISPHPEADVINMQSQAPYTEAPELNNILSNPPLVDVSPRAFTLTTGNSSPWNPLHTEADYRNMAEETSGEMFQTIIDQNRLLRVPDYGATGTARSFSDMDTPAPSSDGRSEPQERLQTQRPRGGRQPGSSLPHHGLQNVRQVRQIGACFRCAVLRERCSPGTPCETCSKVTGRKWCGCLRSFKQMATPLTPKILAERLDPRALRQWMSMNIRFPPEQIEFDLPLSFGFGEPFVGFCGVEYIPDTDEARWTYTVGRGETPLSSQSLYVYPVNSSSCDVQRLIWNWLKRTLMSRESMEDWLSTCFPGNRVDWIRDLLRVILEYSFDCWNDRGLQEIETSQLDRSLLEAWMACLLATILSLQITVPALAISTVVSHLQSVEYNHPFPNTSRALTKCVKSLLFNIYWKFVDRLISTLDNFDQLKPDQISERHMAHILCITVLIMVLTSQIQTSMMDNSRIHSALDIDQGVWEQTLEQLEEVEGVFKNTTLYIRYKRKEWFEYIPAKDIEGSRLLALRQKILDIDQRHLVAIERHGKVQLQRLRHPAALFHIPNMERVFAFFLRHVRTEK